MIRAIVFDFDGLILDTEEPVYRSWLEVYQAHGVNLPFERWVQIVGSSTIGFHPQQHLEERLGRPLPKEVLDRRVGRRSEMILAQELLPGVVEHLEAARAVQLKLGVASSSTREWVRGHLSRLGVAGAEAIAIEDSPNGITAAKRAGMRCVAIPNTITARLDLSHADLVLSSLADVTLAQLVEKLGG